ncbi:flagellar filament capping protein FliD, partial [Acinetobacter baumannii]|uniref:flagellar filament capping protein FliD n=1 Tax=Acinetobacter baumannii TaxID=470 RepID=UPI0033301471
KAYTADDGQIDVRLDALNDQLDKIASDRTALDTRMDKAEERYRKQFSSLDAIVSKYNNVASYLDQMDNERYKLKS